MIERLDGSYIHDDDWDEEKFVLQPWQSRVTQTKDENPSLVTGTPERAGRFCRKRREERSENTPKIDHPNAHATTRRLLR